MTGRPNRRTFRLPLWSGKRAREAVQEELDFHLEQAVGEYLDQGLSPHEARERAIADFGDLDYTREYCTEQARRRTAGRTRMMRFEEMLQDLRFGVRTLRKNPGFTLVVGLTLALGIGANTTIFSLLNPYLVKPLPFGAPDRLLQLAQIDPTQQFESRHSLPQLADFRERARAFEDLAAYYYGTANVTGDEGAERIGMARLTSNFFDVLQVEPLMGRSFAASEQGPASDVVILDHGLWERRYGADPGILGSSIRIDGAPRTVIGVMAPDFVFPFNEVKMWVPMEELPTTSARDNPYMLIVGRLSEGWTPEGAEAELNRIHAELADQFPEADGRFTRVTVEEMRAALNFAWTELRFGAVILGAAVAFVLLIACVNVAGLMLARASARSREMAVRSAIGAGQGRIVRQLVTESLILSVLGGALGLGMTWVATDAVGARLPDSIYRVGDPTIDWRVLAFAATVTLATPMVFGLVPALESARRNLVSALKAGTNDRAAATRLRGRQALVVTQIALAIVLVTGAGLMVRSFLALNAEDLGFDPAQALAAEVRPGDADYPEREAVDDYYRRTIEALQAVPGVRSAATVVPLPMNHELINNRFSPPDLAGTEVEDWPRAMYFRVSPGYFDAMGISLVSGRVFDTGDGAESAPVVLVSEGVATRHWSGSDPVGSSILLGHTDPPTTATVVGVVEDVEEEGFQDVYGAQLYRPAAQSYTRSRYMVIGVNGSLSVTVAPVAEAYRRSGPNVPVLLRPMQVVVDENSYGWRIPSLLLGVFGAVAVVLATLGVYGLISYSVAQRRRELGIRIALGATGRQVWGRVVGEGARLTTLGLLAGLVLAIASAQLLNSQLYGISPLDPVTYALAVLLFGLVALVATARPARTAARTEPVRILNSD